MALIEQSQALIDIGLFMPALREIIVGSWNDYNEDYSAKIRLIHNATTRANILHDHQVARSSRFAVENGFEVADLDRMKILVIGNYAIRFKKFDEFLGSSNHPTKQVKSFRNQVSLSLPGISETYNLEAGYQLTEDQTKIYKTWLIQPSGKGFKWNLELMDSGSKSIVEDLLAKSQANNEYQNVEETAVRGKTQENKVTNITKFKPKS